MSDKPLSMEDWKVRDEIFSAHFVFMAQRNDDYRCEVVPGSHVFTSLIEAFYGELKNARTSEARQELALLNDPANWSNSPGCAFKKYVLKYGDLIVSFWRLTKVPDAGIAASVAAQKAMADEWNNKHPIGQLVNLPPGNGIIPTPTIQRTASKAWVSPTGRAVIMVAYEPSPLFLELITPFYEG